MKVAFASCAALAIASCDEPATHILTAQLYQPEQGCIGTLVGVDVAPGGTASDDCAPECLFIAARDAMSVYVTAMCPPFPVDYTVEAEDASIGDADPCVGAFEAYRKDGATCEGGRDGAADAGPSADASLDAGASD